jgi:hypothetical protein
MPWNMPTTGRTVRFSELPPEMVKLWCAGVIDNLRFDESNERYSFHITGPIDAATRPTAADQS